jgi:hypothetical protein
MLRLQVRNPLVNINKIIYNISIYIRINDQADSIDRFIILTKGDNDMEIEKKAWITPELIVLVRNKPEEAVLAVCKTMTAAGGAPLVNYSSCDSPVPYPCYAPCDAIGAS